LFYEIIQQAFLPCSSSKMKEPSTALTYLTNTLYSVAWVDAHFHLLRRDSSAGLFRTTQQDFPSGRDPTSRRESSAKDPVLPMHASDA